MEYVLYKEYDNSFEDIVRDHNTISVHQHHTTFLTTFLVKGPR